MIKTLATYKDAAKTLGKIDGARFIAYMTMRWAKEEEIQCMSGYASEWADRFLNGVEYQSSDLEGLRVLKQIDCCENCHERLTFDEISDAINHDLKLGEVVCDDCWNQFVDQKYEESKHLDDK